MIQHLRAVLERAVGAEALNKLVGPGLWALFIKIFGSALSYIMFVALARILTPIEYGYFGIAFNLSILASTMCGLGLATGAMRFYPQYITNGQAGLALGYADAALKWIAICSGALIACSILISITGIATPKLGYADAPLAIAVLAAATAFADYIAGLLRAQSKVIWAMAPRDIIWRVLVPLLLLILLWFGFKIESRIAIYLCGVLQLILVALQLWKSRVQMRDLGSHAPQFDWPIWRKTIMPLWASAVLYAMIQQLDVVVVGSLAPTVEAGSYFAAQKTASLLGLVMLAGGLVGAPLMSANYHSGKLIELQRLCGLLGIAIAISTIVGLLILVVFGHQLLGLFDASFMSAYGVLLVLAVGYFVDSMAGPNAYLMQMTGLESTYLKIMGTSYAFVLLAQLLLVPIYGGLGAALASACGIVLWNVWAIVVLRKRKGLDPSVFGLFFKPRHGLNSLTHR